jgi:hypothetical protein
MTRLIVVLNSKFVFGRFLCNLIDMKSPWLDDCSTGVEVEIGGERRVSEHSAATMFCVFGLQLSFL